MATSFRKQVRFRSSSQVKTDQYRLDGGWVTDVHETKLSPDQSPEMSNVLFDGTQNIKTRNGYRRYNGDPIGASSDESNTGASAATSSLTTEESYAAQTFQVGTQADIVQCDFYLAMNTSGQEQYVKAELWSGSTGPDEKLLDGQILLVSGTSETEYSFRFRVPYTLAATTEYAVVIRPYVQGSSSTVNTVLVHRTGSAYASGAAYTSSDAGLTWSAVSSADFKFNVYTGATPNTGLVRYYNTAGVQQTIAKFGTSLYRGNDGTGAMTQITLGSGASLNSVNFVDYTIANDTLLLVDGSGNIQKYRGSTNSNYTTGTISVTNGSATVTGSGTSWNTSTNAEVGEYIQLPDTKWYKITEIASNTSLTIEVDYQGTTLSGQNYTISPWGEVRGDLNRSESPASLVVPTPTFIENHANRIWTLTGNTLRFSSLDTSIDGEHFNDWDTSNNAGAIIIPAGLGDSGTGLYSLNGYLYIFQRNAIWELFGTSPNNFELRNISNEVGMVTQRSLVEWDRYLFFISDSGLYQFDGANLVNVSEGKVKSHIDTWADKKTASAVLWDNKYIVAYKPSGQTYNTQLLVYEPLDQRFSKFTGVYANSWVVWNGGTDNSEIYFGSSTNGTFYRWDVGGHDDGYEIETVFETSSSGYNTEANEKVARKLYLQQIALGDWNMTVSVYSNMDSLVSNTNVNLSPGEQSLWGTMVWGTDQWSSVGSFMQTRIDGFSGNSYYNKFRFEQTGYDAGMEIIGMSSELETVRYR